jgi:hypothetical protein
MLAHGVGLQRVRTQPGESDIGAFLVVAVDKQTGAYERLHRFIDRATVGIFEGMGTGTVLWPR